MALKKDKQKVLGEVFDDERIKTFLDIQPYGDMNADFHVLEKAYRGMKAENFETFVKFFKQDNRDLNAAGEDGKTLLQIVSEHRLGEDYAAILKAAGAE
ncbi:MAG: PA4642 family protein [Cellvibrionaceae bacterium]